MNKIEVIRHSTAHVMALAVQELFKGVKFAIGPSIENGFYYDFALPRRSPKGKGGTFSPEDLPKIEKKMKELIKKDLKFVKKQISKAEAKKIFKNQPYKLELIKEKSASGEKITIYTLGDYVDLCKGPHVKSTKELGYDSFKLTSLAGAYWKGDEKNKMLQRVYGVAFNSKKELRVYLKQQEEAQKRDHRKLGKELEIFTFSEAVGSGLPLWLPKGAALRERLENFLKEVQKKAGYQQVITPHIGKSSLYKTSGHYQKYAEDSFRPITTPVAGEEFFLKPMNCPHHCEIYKAMPHSYRDLPYRIAEFGTVYRYEQSGELHGLTRVRGFTQDDAHIFCTADQLKDEFKGVIDIVMLIFKALDFKDYTVQISLRDPNNKEKYIGSDENWEKAEKVILEVAEERGLEGVVEVGEAAFYGPKMDFMVKDALGRQWQLGTIQVDYNLPERFELEYTGSDNEKHRPIMIHRAPFGSMERFMAVLLEHCAGKFPLWLTPEQVIILPISEKYHNYAKKVLNLLNNYEIRALVDERSEKTGKKIRDAEMQKIPYMLIVGEKEENEGNVSVRKQSEGDLGSFAIENFAEMIQKEVKESLEP